MISDAIRNRFQLALGQPSPFDSLYNLAVALKAEGISQLEMYHLFNEFRAKLAHDERLEDAVLDTMDLIVGCGHRGYWIFEQELDRRLYDKAFMSPDEKEQKRDRDDLAS